MKIKTMWFGAVMLMAAGMAQAQVVPDRASYAQYNTSTAFSEAAGIDVYQYFYTDQVVSDPERPVQQIDKCSYETLENPPLPPDTSRAVCFFAPAGVVGLYDGPGDKKVLSNGNYLKADIYHFLGVKFGFGIYLEPGMGDVRIGVLGDEEVFPGIERRSKLFEVRCRETGFCGFITTQPINEIYLYRAGGSPDILFTGIMAAYEPVQPDFRYCPPGLDPLYPYRGWMWWWQNNTSGFEPIVNGCIETRDMQPGRVGGFIFQDFVIKSIFD